MLELLLKGGFAFQGKTVDNMTYVELAVVLILLTAKYIVDHRIEAMEFDRFGKMDHRNQYHNWYICDRRNVYQYHDDQSGTYALS